MAFEFFPKASEWLPGKYPDLAEKLERLFQSKSHYVRIMGVESGYYVGPFITENSANEWLEQKGYHFDAEGGASVGNDYAVVREGEIWKNSIGHDIVIYATKNYSDSADEQNRQFAEEQIEQINIIKP